MKHLILVLGMAMFSQAADIAGDWTGTLKTGGPELRLNLHFEKTSTGQLKATMDSVDQGAKGIPVSSLSLEGNQLKLDVSTIKGAYDATVSEDGKTITGTWSQGGNSLPLSLARGSAKLQSVAAGSEALAPLAGIWEGTLDTGAAKLRVRFKLQAASDGQFTGSFDSIDQGANGMPISGMSLNGSAFQFDLGAVGGEYAGKVSADRQTIEGIWKQPGVELPLEWKRTKALQP